MGYTIEEYTKDIQNICWQEGFLYEGYCYTTTSDNNGAGYKQTDWYKYLICLAPDHTLW